MISLGEIVCPKCSGKLVRKGWYALCTKCGERFIIESHANGRFKSIRKIDGQMSEENDYETLEIPDYKEQIAELRKQLDNNLAMILSQNSEIFDVKEVLQGFIKYKNDWVADVFLHNIDKYVLTKKQKWHLVAQHIHNKKLLETLDSKVGFARQTVKQPDPFKFCSKCGYSGNVRDIVCPECHNSYFRKTEKKEYKCPICQEKISLDTEFDCPTCESEITLKEMEDSGGEKELPKHENGLNHMHGINSETCVPDSKLPELCKKCKHFIPNINKLGHSYCWELDLKMAYDYPSACSQFEPKEKTEPKNDEPWECPICHKTVYIGYTVHRHCLDKLIEGFIKFIDHFEECYEGKKCGECLEYWKTIKEHYKGA